MGRAGGAAGARIVSAAPWAGVAALLLVLLVHRWYTPDIFTHLFLGREILPAGSAQPPDPLLLVQPSYLNVYWLFQLIVWSVFRASGFAGTTLLFATLWVAAFVLWGKTARVFQFPILGAPLALLCVLVCQVRFEERPEVLSFLLLALQVRLLSAGPSALSSPRDWILLGLSQLIWTNVHGYFVLGPALALLRLVTLHAETPSRSWRGLARVRARLAGAAALTAAASVVSPFGPGVWLNVLTLARLAEDLGVAVHELGPPLGSYLDLWTVKLFWLLWLLTAAGAVTRLVSRGRRDLFAPALAAVGLVLSASALRNIPLAVFLSAPLWGALLSWAVETRPALGGRAVRVAGALVALASAILAGWTVQGGLYRSLDSPTRFGIGLREHAFPVRFGRYLSETGFRGKIFNHPGDGGYLEYHFPDVRPYADARFVEPGAVREYFEGLFSLPGFRRLHERHDFDGVLLDLARGQFALFGLLDEPGWKLAYGDPHRAFLVDERTPAGAAAPVWTPRFYTGEDLGDKVQGVCAVRWTNALARLGRADLLLVQLRELAASPRIPSPVLEHALAYGVRTGDGEILRAAAALRPRMVALTARDAEAVDRLMAHEAVRRVSPVRP